MAGRAPQQRPQASEQLLGVERFGQIVVGAGVEPGDLFAPCASRGEDQHRRREFARRQPSRTETPSILGRPRSSTMAS